MNKKAETGFYVGVAILSVILVVLGAKIAFLDNRQHSSNKPGVALEELIDKEIKYNNLENYLYYSFKFSVLSALNTVLESNGEWAENQKEVIKNEIIEKTKEELLKRIETLKNEMIIERKGVVFPQEFNIEIAEDRNIIKIKLLSNDELTVKDTEKDYPIVKLHDNLRFEEEIDFDLKIIDRLYEKYSKVESEEECNNVKENELFGENKVKCAVEDDIQNDADFYPSLFPKN